MNAWWRALRVLACVCACAGCASASESGAASPAVARAAAKPADPLARAHTLAPDYVARVYAARRAAADEPTAFGRQQAGKSVQLLELAALAEAERIKLTRQLTSYERRIERAELERAALERQSLELARERMRQLAAAQERSEAEWAFSLLQRVAGQALSSVERDRAWVFLVRRSAALLAVARRLGADGGSLEAAELQLTAARAAKLPERIARARGALLRAGEALGSARARASEPSVAERADLVQRLAERGFVLRASEPEAIALDLPPASGGLRGLRERFLLLAELLPAFPHGPIVLGCASPGARSGGRGGPVGPACDYAQALMPGERARVQWQARPPELPSGALRVILPGYAGARN